MIASASITEATRLMAASSHASRSSSAVALTTASIGRSSMLLSLPGRPRNPNRIGGPLTGGTRQYAPTGRRTSSPLHPCLPRVVPPLGADGCTRTPGWPNRKPDERTTRDPADSDNRPGVLRSGYDGGMSERCEVRVRISADAQKVIRELKRTEALLDNVDRPTKRDDVRRLTDPATVTRKALGEMEGR